MKTTVDIPAAVLQAARKAAAEDGTTVKAVVDAALRRYLEQRERESMPFTLRTHTFGGKGLQPGLKEGDWGSILERAYEGRGG